jgi:hypothetical protein
MSGLRTVLLADDGLDGSGTASVDVEEAGLTQEMKKGARS